MVEERYAVGPNLRAVVATSIEDGGDRGVPQAFERCLAAMRVGQSGDPRSLMSAIACTVRFLQGYDNAGAACDTVPRHRVVHFREARLNVSDRLQLPWRTSG